MPLTPFLASLRKIHGVNKNLTHDTELPDGEKDPASREAFLECKGIEMFVLLVTK